MWKGDRCLGDDKKMLWAASEWGFQRQYTEVKENIKMSPTPVFNFDWRYQRKNEEMMKMEWANKVPSEAF